MSPRLRRIAQRICAIFSGGGDRADCETTRQPRHIETSGEADPHQEPVDAETYRLWSPRQNLSNCVNSGAS